VNAHEGRERPGEIVEPTAAGTPASSIVRNAVSLRHRCVTRVQGCASSFASTGLGRVKQSDLPERDAQLVERLLRLVLTLVSMLEHKHASISRLTRLLFGPWSDNRGQNLSPAPPSLQLRYRAVMSPPVRPRRMKVD
jgi:hypothetical protein